jgi:hypothetical protein
MASTEVDSAAAAGSELATPPMRLQILSTEHWSLLASRGLAWNESFTRAGMFLSTLSFATVALALVAQATGFSADFRLFALVILPVVLFLGIGTQLRLDHANYHDVQCIIGMNRIRAKYAEMAPDLAGLFVMGQTDDTAGIARTMGLIPWRSTPLNLIAATPVVVGVLNGVLFAAIVALGAAQLGVARGYVEIVSVVAFLLALAMLAVYSRRVMTAGMARNHPMFPTPATDAYGTGSASVAATDE